MVTKEEAIEVLNKAVVQENEQKVAEYIWKINTMSDADWDAFLVSRHITDRKQLEEVVSKLLTKKEANKFEKLNDLVSFGYAEETVHIHVVPKDVRGLLSRKGLMISEGYLIDALEKIADKLEKDEKFKDINQIYAVSGLIRKPISKIFENLDFDVKSMKIEEAKEDSELQRFYERFKDNKYLGRATLSREKLLSDEWNKLKDKRKKELSKENLLDSAVEATKKVTKISKIENVKENIKEIQLKDKLPQEKGVVQDE